MTRRQLIRAIALAAPIAAGAGALATGPETITVRLRINDQMTDRLRAIAEFYPGVVRAALRAEGERIMAKAKRDHPLPWPDPSWPR